MRKTMLLLLTGILASAGCHNNSAAPPAVASGLPTVKMHIGNANFTLEVAKNDDTRERGLMYRDTMADDHGMIFVFPREQPLSFWMKNTKIPLDILYLDADATIVSIKHMKPYDWSAVPSDKPAKYAIELNDGTADTVGAKVGDRLEIPADAQQTDE